MSLEDASDLVFLYVTFPTHELALEVGNHCVKNQFAACVNIFPPHVSIYSWKGGIESTPEYAAIFKTIDGKIDELSQAIREKHPYDTPCIVAFIPDQIDTRFGNWIRDSVSPDKTAL
jgi:periplasmic divalent cation tolerance protein